MKYLVTFLLMLATASAAEKQDIKLNDGRHLKAAAIVAIGKETAIITHAAGVVTVEHDLVPLDILARAHMELQATEAERKKKASELTAKANENSAAEKAKRDEELRIRLAMANAHTSAATAPAVGGKPSAALEKEIARLKSALPTHDLHGSQDPAIRDCISKYTRAFNQITATTVPPNAKWIRDNIARDSADYQKTLATTDGVIRGGSKSATGAMRIAATKNLAWLRALSGHIDRIERVIQ